MPVDLVRSNRYALRVDFTGPGHVAERSGIMVRLYQSRYWLLAHNVLWMVCLIGLVFAWVNFQAFGIAPSSFLGSFLSSDVPVSAAILLTLLSLGMLTQLNWSTIVARFIIRSFDFWFLSVQGLIGVGFAITLASSSTQRYCCFSFWFSIQSCLLRDAILPESFRFSLVVLCVFQFAYLSFLAVLYGFGYCGDQTLHVGPIEASVSSLLSERCLILAVFFLKFFVQNLRNPDRLMLSFCGLMIRPAVHESIPSPSSIVMMIPVLPTASSSSSPATHLSSSVVTPFSPPASSPAAAAPSRQPLQTFPQESSTTTSSSSSTSPSSSASSFITLTPFPLPPGIDDLDEDISVLSTLISLHAHQIFTRFLEKKPVAVVSFTITAGCLIAMCLTFVNAANRAVAVLGIFVGIWVTLAWMLRYHPLLIRLIWSMFQTWFIFLNSLAVIGLSVILHSDEPVLLSAVVMTMVVLMLPAGTRDAAVSPGFRKRLFAGFVLSSGYPIYCAIIYGFGWASKQVVQVLGHPFRVHNLLADRYLTSALFFVKNIVVHLFKSGDRLVTIDWPLQIVRPQRVQIVRPQSFQIPRPKQQQQQQQEKKQIIGAANLSPLSPAKMVSVTVRAKLPVVS